MAWGFWTTYNVTTSDSQRRRQRRPSLLGDPGGGGGSSSSWESLEMKSRGPGRSLEGRLAYERRLLLGASPDWLGGKEEARRGSPEAGSLPGDSLDSKKSENPEEDDEDEMSTSADKSNEIRGLEEDGTSSSAACPACRAVSGLNTPAGTASSGALHLPSPPPPPPPPPYLSTILPTSAPASGGVKSARRTHHSSRKEPRPRSVSLGARVLLLEDPGGLHGVGGPPGAPGSRPPALPRSSLSLFESSRSLSSSSRTPSLERTLGPLRGGGCGSSKCKRNPSLPSSKP